MPQQSRGFRRASRVPARRKVKGVSLVLRGTRTPPTLSGSLRGGPNGHAPGRAVGLLQRTLQSHLTHTRARVGESHLQHPLLAITGWALPAARGALTAGNGLESNTPPDDATHVWVSSGGTSVECCYCRPEGLLYSTALHTRSWRDGRDRSTGRRDYRVRLRALLLSGDLAPRDPKRGRLPPGGAPLPPYPARARRAVNLPCTCQSAGTQLLGGWR